MTTVLFDSHAGLVNDFASMTKYYEDIPSLGIKGVVIYHDKYSFKKNAHVKEKELLSNYWHEGHQKYTAKDLKEFELKTGDINLWNMIYSDRFLEGKSFEYIIKQNSFFLHSWQVIFDKYNPQYVVTDIVAGMWSYILYALCKMRGITYLGFMTTKLKNGYFYSQDYYGHFPEMEQKFKELKRRALTEDEKKQVTNYVSSFRNKPTLAVFIKNTASKPNLSRFINPYRLSILILRDLKQRFFEKHYDYTLPYRSSRSVEEFKKYLRIKSLQFLNVFEKPDMSKNYILFPLHFQPEISTSIWATYYSDQLNTITQIAKSLPLDYYLYVKEHWALLGTKPLDFYKKLKRLPNVKLIIPTANTPELIKNAKAISILTGTMGLEGIVYNKPVIIFGQVFFDFYPYLIKVDCLQDLPELIKKAIHQNINENDELRMKFLHAYINSGYSGDMFNTGTSKENIETISKELIKEIDNCKNYYNTESLSPELACATS